MALAFRIFPDEGIVCLFIEAPGGGDIEDINSLGNRPAKSPEDWLGNIKFHSGLNFMEVAATATTEKSHTSAAAGSTYPSGSGVEVDAGNSFGYQVNIEDFAICTHSLGYEPYAAVVVDGTMLFPGMPVQIGTSGAARYATAYVTTTEVRVETWCSVGADALAAADITYEAVVFRDPRAASGDTLFEFDPSTGISKMGMTKFQNDRKYLQVADGATPFGIVPGRGGDLDNGAPRFVKTDGTVFDPVPDTTKLRVGPSPISALGDPMTYGGSYAAPDIIEVQVPDDPPGGDSGFSFNPTTGVLAFEYDGRTTLSGAGKMVCLLPEVTINAQAIDFPDVTKGNGYRWSWSSQYNAINQQYGWNSKGIKAVTANPQEWEEVTTIMAAPTGADFVIGIARLNRITAPDDWIFSDPLDVAPVENKWMPFMGGITCMVEAGYGFARIFAVYIEDGNLKLWRKHSVSNEPGGYGAWGDSGPKTSQTTSGGEFTGFGTPGMAVKIGSGKSSSGTTSQTFFIEYKKHKWDGADPATVSDTTDFSSEYELDLRFSFGRVS